MANGDDYAYAGKMFVEPEGNGIDKALSLYSEKPVDLHSWSIDVYGFMPTIYYSNYDISVPYEPEP